MNFSRRFFKYLQYHVNYKTKEKMLIGLLIKKKKEKRISIKLNEIDNVPSQKMLSYCCLQQN